MKKGCMKLFGFELFAIIILLFNSFIYNFLSSYALILFLILYLISFNFLFGFNRRRNRISQDVFLEIIIFLMIFFIIYFFSGLFIGFAKSGNYYSLKGVSSFIIPTLITIILREFLRYQILTKAKDYKICIVMSVIMFLFVDIYGALYYGSFKNAYSVFIFFALTFLPSLSNNILLTYVSLKSNYKPCILYGLVMGLYQYLIPIVPNPTKFLTSVIRFLVPFILMFRLRIFLSKRLDEDIEVRNKPSKGYVSFGITFALIFIIIFFSSGYFGYNLVAIATGSMEPVIHKGDVVVIHELEDYRDLEVGKTIAFKYSNVIIVHRIIKVEIDNGKYYYYTKGDANNSADNWVVDEGMIQGVISYRIPYIGIPTVWLNDL